MGCGTTNYVVVVVRLVLRVKIPYHVQLHDIMNAVAASIMINNIILVNTL